MLGYMLGLMSGLRVIALGEDMDFYLYQWLLFWEAKNAFWTDI